MYDYFYLTAILHYFCFPGVALLYSYILVHHYISYWRQTQ